MDGYEVLQQLREQDSDYAPVLVLTALDDKESRIRALELGARDFVSKPFDRVELLSRIRNLLEMRLLHNAVRQQNVMLEQKVRERTRELHDSRLEIIRRLSRAADYRDNETGNHILRMSKYSQLLGLAAGMAEAEAEMLLTASPMHDIGKIGIPDSILLKPGKLTPEEWEVMKTHASIGASILEGLTSDLMHMAHQIALTHHEKWDGSGYPNSLKGEDISFYGRIVAVADVFDALTTNRPYKAAWPVERAMDYITSQKSQHFDPQLVEHFVRILPEILTYKAKYADPDK
jgi:putative two-component system response regulator